MKVIACLPAHNEEKHIETVLKEIKVYVDDIVVCDDGSTDKTIERAKPYTNNIIPISQKQGKGNALRCACDMALELGADILVLIDSDGQHKPTDIPKLMGKFKEIDMIFTYRVFTGEMPFKFRLGNIGLSIITWIMFGIRLKDTQCGLKIMTADTYKKIRWTANDYSMESEMTAKIKKNNIKFIELPISTIYHVKNKGTTIKDGFKIFRNLMKWRIYG